jgi:transglutaminase-like putative cysteine protease
MYRRVFALRTCVALVLLFSLSSFAQDARQRHFTFDYEFTVRNPHTGKPLRIWIPVAQSDPWQQVRILSAQGDLPLKSTQERRYGNRMFYAATAHAGRAEYHFIVRYEVVRKERVAFRNGVFAGGPRLREVELRRYLEPDRLVPTTGVPAQLAAEQVQGKSGELARARAIYDYVLQNMRYDKSGTGWGRGDALWACDAKRGNCTDFHSLFASMARSQHIPTRFAIGFPLPADKAGGQIAGYHCWADFYLKDRGWVPVDISEAWKDPTKRDYFFGAHDENRVQFSIGRDLVLAPRQDGAPLNYFVFPYVESGRKEFPNVNYHFSFADMERGRQAATMQDQSNPGRHLRSHINPE